MSDEHSIDIIKEVVNVGMGGAASALSKLLNARVVIKVPDVRVIDVSEVQAFIKEEVASVGVHISQDFFGMVRGKTLLLYSRECSFALLSSISGKREALSSLTQSEIATLEEVGNIIMVSFLAKIGDMIEGRILFEIPILAEGISEEYFRSVVKEWIELDKVIIVKNEMTVRERAITGHLFLLLSFEDFQRIINRLDEIWSLKRAPG
jgi:chemotaxis protein CheC